MESLKKVSVLNKSELSTHHLTFGSHPGLFLHFHAWWNLQLTLFFHGHFSWWSRFVSLSVYKEATGLLILSEVVSPLTRKVSSVLRVSMGNPAIIWLGIMLFVKVTWLGMRVFDDSQTPGFPHTDPQNWRSLSDETWNIFKQDKNSSASY